MNVFVYVMVAFYLVVAPVGGSLVHHGVSGSLLPYDEPITGIWPIHWGQVSLYKVSVKVPPSKKESVLFQDRSIVLDLAFEQSFSSYRKRSFFITFDSKKEAAHYMHSDSIEDLLEAIDNGTAFYRLRKISPVWWESTIFRESGSDAEILRAVKPRDDSAFFFRIDETNDVFWKIFEKEG
jgi:hypothetical protein